VLLRLDFLRSQAKKALDHRGDQHRGTRDGLRIFRAGYQGSDVSWRKFFFKCGGSLGECPKIYDIFLILVVNYELVM
jgi:hypothetical protein